MAMTAPLEERFWRYVPHRPEDGCWEWTGTRSPNGYGIIRLSHCRKKKQATHVSIFLHTGEWVPPGLAACHRCDNRGCVNPAHLFVGTYSDNMRDMVAKGRHWSPFPTLAQRGESNPTSKLTEAQVIAIRASDKRQQQLAAEHGVCQQLISDIKRRRAWTHI